MAKKEDKEKERGRKKKGEDEGEQDDKSGILASLKSDTVDAVIAIAFIFVAILLILASAGKAGIIGGSIFKFLSFLFGIGYFLLPIILIILGLSFLAQLKHNLAIPKIISGTLFFISSLGLVSLLFDNAGIVGRYISSPLVSLFDFWVTLTLLLSISLIAILILFDTSLKISKIQNLLSRFKNGNQSEETNTEGEDGNEDENGNNVTITNGEYDEDEDDNDYDEKKYQEVKEKQNTPTPNKKTSGLVFFSRPSGKNVEFTPPPISLLEKDSGKPDVGDVKANTNIIKRTLSNFGIQVEMDEVSIGPSVTRYALKPAEGVKLSKLVALQNDLALALAAHPIRIEAPIPGKSLVGIEIPNTKKTLVGLGSLLKSPAFSESDKPLFTCLGKGITGQSNFADLAKMPHMLIAGATGAGKSVTIHALITSLLYRNHPDNLKFIMIDPKRVELTLYNSIPHLLTPVITDPKKTILALKWAAQEMNRRYDILESKSVRDISSYHENIYQSARKRGDTELPENMPYIVIIIDELADIMQTYPRELEAGIVRLAQMSRAVGIHLMLSTQRPSVNVITGLIKANIPARVALQVASQIDSRTILDMPGAEKLLGAGDLLYLSGEMSQPRRIQSAFISEEEVKKVVDWLATHYADQMNDDTKLDFSTDSNKNDVSPIFESMEEDTEDDDDLYAEAKEIVISAGKASTSYIQRRLRVGYSRAARLIDMLEERGVVGPPDGSKPREILTTNDSNDAHKSERDRDNKPPYDNSDEDEEESGENNDGAKYT